MALHGWFPQKSLTVPPSFPAWGPVTELWNLSNKFQWICNLQHQNTLMGCMKILAYSGLKATSMAFQVKHSCHHHIDEILHRSLTQKWISETQLPLWQYSWNCLACVCIDGALVVWPGMLFPNSRDSVLKLLWTSAFSLTLIFWIEENILCTKILAGRWYQCHWAQCRQSWAFWPSDHCSSSKLSHTMIPMLKRFKVLRLNLKSNARIFYAPSEI